MKITVKYQNEKIDIIEMAKESMAFRVLSGDTITYIVHSENTSAIATLINIAMLEMVYRYGVVHSFKVEKS